MLIVFLAEWDWTGPELPVDRWWFFGIVLVLLVVAIWLIARLTSSATGDIDSSEIDRQMLSVISELRSQGELTSEEYRSVKSRLVERLSDQPPSADSEDSSHKVQQLQQTEGQQQPTTDTCDETTGTVTGDGGDPPHHQTS